MKWTVFAEEKPTVVGSYLVTHRTEDGTREVGYVDYDFWTVFDKFKYHDEDVIAWMPFPQPYIAKESE